MFTEQEVFAKIGFLTMALDKVQQQLTQTAQALQEAQSTPEEETDEPAGDEDGRKGEVGGENS